MHDDDTTKPQKIPVWRITMHRRIVFSEPDGRTSDLVSTADYTANLPYGVWDNANHQLQRWAVHCSEDPKEYELVPYDLLFFNGCTVTAQFGLQRSHREGVNLAQSILASLHLYAGTFKPANFTHRNYSDFLAKEAGRRELAAGILDGYDFGEEFRPPAGPRTECVEQFGASLASGILSYLEGKTS